MAYLTNVSVEIEGENAGKVLKTLLPDAIIEAEDNASYAQRSVEVKYVDQLLEKSQKLSGAEQCSVVLIGDGEDKTDSWIVKFKDGEKTMDVTFFSLLEHYINTTKTRLRIEAVGENAANALKELFWLEKVNHTTIVKRIDDVGEFVESALEVSQKHNVILKVYGIGSNGIDAWYRQFEKGKIVYFKDFFNCVENDPVRIAPRPEPGKEVVETKSYLIEVKKLRDGTTHLSRVNKGFTAIELLGLISMANRQITDTLENAAKPDKLERRYEKAD